MNEQITIDEAVEKIEYWRANRTGKRGRIPSDIWNVAIHLAKTNSVHYIAEKMNLKFSDLQSKISDIKQPLSHIKTQSKKKKQAIVTGESLVEVTSMMPVTSKCLLELELAGGAVVRIYQ